MKVDATFERAPLTLSSLYMLEGKAEKAVEVLISNNFIFSCIQMHISGVGSNRVLQGPLIQIVGVALITKFCDHNHSFVEVVFQ